LTGADGPYNDDAFRANISPRFHVFCDMTRLRLCRHFVFIGLGSSEITLVKRRGIREGAASFKTGLFPIRNEARGKKGTRLKN
jgi:hypothetical protein